MPLNWLQMFIFLKTPASTKRWGKFNFLWKCSAVLQQHVLFAHYNCSIITIHAYHINSQLTVKYTYLLIFQRAHNMCSYTSNLKKKKK